MFVRRLLISHHLIVLLIPVLILVTFTPSWKEAVSWQCSTNLAWSCWQSYGSNYYRSPFHHPKSKILYIVPSSHLNMIFIRNLCSNVGGLRGSHSINHYFSRRLIRIWTITAIPWMVEYAAMPTFNINKNKRYSALRRCYFWTKRYNLILDFKVKPVNFYGNQSIVSFGMDWSLSCYDLMNVHFQRLRAWTSLNIDN